MIYMANAFVLKDMVNTKVKTVNFATLLAYTVLVLYIFLLTKMSVLNVMEIKQC